MRARLHEVHLHYGGGLTLHTASSGAVGDLHELVVVLDDGDHQALGAVRINIAYLNGFPADAVRQAALDALPAFVRAVSASLDGGLASIEGLIAPVRMLLDIAVHDLAGKRAGRSLAAFFGGPWGALSLPTNQTLFRSSDEEMLARAEAYAARGFVDLKLRIGAPDFADDLRRVALIRGRFGSSVKLAADANGQWSLADARDCLAALARYDLAYVEQPVMADFPDVVALAEASPIPIMLDESIDSPAAVDAAVAAGGRLWVHLKLVKLGGIGPTLDAARKLAEVGVPMMIGQMNEGTIATAAAAHVAAVVAPRFAELYGADGLSDDPASGLTYADGAVHVSGSPGLGVAFDPTHAHLIGEFSA